MAEDLEQGTKPAEGEKASSEEEKAKITSEETKKPTLVKTYTEEEFKKAQSSWDKQITLSKAEAKKAGVQAEQFKAEQKHSENYIQSLKTEMEKLASSVEDEDVKKTYTSRMASLDREMTVAKRESDADAKLYEAEQIAWSARMAQKATEMVKETGIDVKELEGCQTEEELEAKALRFQISNPKEEVKPEEKTPKFDSVISTPGAGTGFSMAEVKKLKPAEFDKKLTEILEAERQGKLK